MIKRFAACLFLVPASPAAHAAQFSSSAAIKVVKPLKLTKLQDLDFGTVTLDGTTGRADDQHQPGRRGHLPRGAGLRRRAEAARFNVQGTNRAVVIITVPNVTLSNGSDTIPFTARCPGDDHLPNSGTMASISASADRCGRRHRRRWASTPAR